MTPDQYATATKYLGFSQAKASRVLGVSYRQALRWKAGDSKVPETAARMLSLLLDIKRNDTPDDFDYVLKLIGG